jgi:rhodanese-related sulfurtransferase
MASGTETIGIEDARREIAGGDAVAIDVRSEEEWGKAHVPGATHLPAADLDTAADRPERGARLIVIADDGELAAKAATRLSDQGYDAVAAEGGMDAWISEDFNVQPTDDPDEDTELGAG